MRETITQNFFLQSVKLQLYSGGQYMSNFLLYSQENHIVTLTMNQPERRNPLQATVLLQNF